MRNCRERLNGCRAPPKKEGFAHTWKGTAPCQRPRGSRECAGLSPTPVRGHAWQGGPKRVGFAGAGLLEVAEPREGVPRGVKRVPLGETQGGVFISHCFPWEKSEGQWSEGEPLGARRP